jgi:hypothetical protein
VIRAAYAPLDLELVLQRATAELDVAHESIAVAAFAAAFAKLRCSDAVERARCVADVALLNGVRAPELLAAGRRLRARLVDELVARGRLDVPRAQARTTAPIVTSYAAVG